MSDKTKLPKRIRVEIEFEGAQPFVLNIDPESRELEAFEFSYPEIAHTGERRFRFDAKWVDLAVRRRFEATEEEP